MSVLYEAWIKLHCSTKTYFYKWKSALEHALKSRVLENHSKYLIDNEFPKLLFTLHHDREGERSMSVKFLPNNFLALGLFEAFEKC